MADCLTYQETMEVVLEQLINNSIIMIMSIKRHGILRRQQLHCLWRVWRFFAENHDITLIMTIINLLCIKNVFVAIKFTFLSLFSMVTYRY